MASTVPYVWDVARRRSAGSARDAKIPQEGASNAGLVCDPAGLRLADIALEGRDVSDSYPPTDAFPEFMATLLDEEDPGWQELPSHLIVPTGFREIDETLGGGIRTGQLTLIAGVAGVGTSILATDIARAAAFRRRVRTAMIAPDSPRSELITRVIAAEAGVPIAHIRSRSLRDDDRRRLIDARQSLEAAPLWVNAEYGITMGAKVVLDTVRYMTDEPGARLVIIDGTSQSEPDNRSLALGLRGIAQERRIAVVVVSKSVVSTTLKGSLPSLDELREYQEIGDLFDLVLTLHREDLYSWDSKRAGEADLEITKHRYGPQRRFVLAFQGHYGRFVEMAPSS